MARIKLTYPTFRCAPAVVCGAGALRMVAEQAGDAAFMLSGARFVRERLDDAVARAGRLLPETDLLVKPPGEPNMDAIRFGARFLSRRQPKTIVAIGGGSVLDWARLAWSLEGGALDDAGRVRDGATSALRPDMWLVPTTCGTGAEAGDVAVYSSEAGRKAAVVMPAFLADRVILDGHFLAALRPDQVAASLCDALSHGIEACLSLVPAELGKQAALGCVTLILENAATGASSSRAERLMEAGFLGGVAAANCSVGVVHAFAHSIGVDGVGHGLANACALMDGIRFNASTAQMRVLLNRLHLVNAPALIERLRAVVVTAVTGGSLSEPIQALADARYRSEIALRMSQDVAIRSNPRRATREDLEGFVQDVHQTVQALCQPTS